MPRKPNSKAPLERQRLYLRLLESAGHYYSTDGELAEALGVTRNTLYYRRKYPESIRLEHLRAINDLMGEIADKGMVQAIRYPLEDS